MAGNGVLVVDSDGSSTALLTEIVGEKAYDIVSVEDGDAALAHLKKQLPVAMLIDESMKARPPRPPRAPPPCIRARSCKMGFNV